MTRAGWATALAAVVLGGAAMAAHQPALVALGVACAAALVCSVATMAVRPRLSLERRLAATRVTAGDAVSVELTATNESARPSATTMAVDSLGAEPLRVAIPTIGGRGTRTVHYELPAPRRGVFTLAPLVVTRPDPLGLTRIAPLTSVDDLTVWVHPRTSSVAPIPAGYQLSEDGPRGTDVHQGALVFHSLREYVVGDDIRHIHWRSSAHAGDLLVRENLETTTPTAAVVLDTRAAVHSDTSFEATWRSPRRWSSARCPTECRSSWPPPAGSRFRPPTATMPSTNWPPCTWTTATNPPSPGSPAPAPPPPAATGSCW